MDSCNIHKGESDSLKHVNNTECICVNHSFVCSDLTALRHGERVQFFTHSGTNAVSLPPCSFTVSTVAATAVLIYGSNQQDKLLTNYFELFVECGHVPGSFPLVGSLTNVSPSPPVAGFSGVGTPTINLGLQSNMGPVLCLSLSLIAFSTDYNRVKKIVAS